MRIEKLTINGVEEPMPLARESSPDNIELKRSFRVMGFSRGIAEKHEVEIKDGELVELVFDDDTTWYCNGNTIDQVFPEATVQTRGMDGFEIPVQLRADGAETRGIVGDISLKLINIFARKAAAPEVKKLAADLEQKQLENYSGLYMLDKSFAFRKFVPENTGKPYLLFIHGTSSSTRGSFGELVNTELWQYIYQTYGNNVLAFQHETLTKSPLENVLDLVNSLPANVTLHLITHSRGGLVGDVLSRFCNADENNRGFDENEISYLKNEGRDEDVACIAKLKELFANRSLVVGRFIRVACPGGGTTLASRRLDNFFNITLNLIGLGTGLAVNPVYGAFKNLMASVIDFKNDVHVLPGLEAMDPDSPFIKVLNSPSTHVVLDKQLTVISGNCKVKPNLKALLIIASRLFYFHDNDLVVNTRSMYQGAKRNDLIQYYFDEATDVDHFHYFKNQKTNNAILQALKAVDNNLIPGFSRERQEAVVEMQRNALLKLDGGQVFTNTVTGTKPIVVLLPGIMGSNLAMNGNLLWINYLKFIGGQLKDLTLKNNGAISAPSLVSTSYRKLVEYLKDSYDVVTFPFDWRLQLNDCAAKFNDKIKELLQYRQPIKIIGHSMGGVLVRDFIINYDDTWKALNQSPGFRLIFLGSPLGGSFRIPAVLFGQDDIIGKLSKIDIFHSKKDLAGIFVQLPGILSLLPLSEDTDDDFSNMEVWNKMAMPSGDWPLPDKRDLAVFKNYRDAILKKMDGIDYTNIVYIAGHDSATPCGYRMETTESGEELVFLSTAEGDQSVTWDSGIPKKMIEQKAVYYSNVSHGQLANDQGLFKPIADILANGYTTALSKVRPVVRGEQKLFRAPLPHDFDITPAGVERTVLGLGGGERQEVPQQRLNVSISNGDLRYAQYPLLAGHFYNDGILYAEKMIDQNLEGALSRRHRLGIYPGEIGSSEIFITENSDFSGAIIVGLGKQGELTAFQLTQTVEQAISKYLLDMSSKVMYKNGIANNGTEILGVSSLVIGCGFGGLPVENSIRAIIRGVQNANGKVRALQEDAKIVECVEFIELYEDKALSCLYSLKKLEQEENGILNISTGGKKIKRLLGSRSRIPASDSKDWWNRITVQMIKKPEFNGDIRCLQFSASTGGAREEQRELYSSTAVVEQLIEDISRQNRWSADVAKTIFELLIPNDFKEQLQRQGNINLIVDKFTASYPWELLQNSVMDAQPLCVNAGMIRQLSTQDYRLRIKQVTKDNALVVGDPNLNGFIQQLPGAKEEATAVTAMMEEMGYSTQSLINEDATEIIRTLFSDDYKIIHLAGHGIFDEKVPEGSTEKTIIRSGMVIGKDIYLSTREIIQMSTVPELVFVNCCYLGQTVGATEEIYQSRYKLAANIGTQLIENGVKAVVVAGWAVDDAAAMDFTKNFYENMFNGYGFGEAVRRARKLIYDKYQESNNTWGAYQCYGDPYYRIRTNAKKKEEYKCQFVIAQEAEIELKNLTNELETGMYASNEIYGHLEAIAKAVDLAGLRNALITELEALIYAEMGDYDIAIGKLGTLFTMEKASFSVSTLEKYCNLRAKKLVFDFKKQVKGKKYIPEINQVIKELDALLSIGPTAERWSLLGSTCKRKAMLLANMEQKEKAYEEAVTYYRKAYETTGNQYSIYSLTNLLEVESMLVLMGGKWKGNISFAGTDYQYSSSDDVVRILEKALDVANNYDADMDFWNLVEKANLKLCGMIADPSAAEDRKKVDDVLDAYRKIWHMAGSKAKKLTELEHLEFLIDAVTSSKKRNTKLLKNTLEQLRDELQKLI